ncbi:magnesium transporter [Oligosphaera ethanolica]|uniref:Magnesium transporter MgtE n=1 Tax=Oligosphaera ethanolica TaxID=760260 RepID=A0AAE3VE72_9BACT|nr:magnesium transporter [Oligosphaera ethanolica]MDQ0288604.1 magnesium transporter [Oligosphaera ethanolica]
MEAILELLEKNRLPELREKLVALNPADVASALGEVGKDKLLLVFRLLPKDFAAAVFTYLDPDLHRLLAESITDQEINDLINRLFVDDAVDFLEELPANMVTGILAHADPTKRAAINAALRYPDNSAGGLMTIEFIYLFEAMTAAEALAHIRKRGMDRETIYTCYVTSPQRVLTGAVSLRRILLSKDDALIRDLMTTPVIAVHTHDDQEDVAQKFREYDLIAMPVIDNEQRIVGIITIDDIIDVIVAENTEDIEKMAALHPSESEYLKTGVWRLARNRIFWLLFMMISATLTGAVISHYQELLQTVVILAAFIPMLMDTGGNCGAQASTLIIRGMAVGEIELSNWLKVVWKEFRVGILVSLVLASVNLLRIMLFVKDSNPRVDLVVTLTLFITIVFAKLIGCLLPMFAKRLRFDPALMASPMLTTIVDAFALMIYFSLAGLFLGL